jgi:hypothetical protein
LVAVLEVEIEEGERGRGHQARRLAVPVCQRVVAAPEGQEVLRRFRRIEGGMYIGVRGSEDP